MQVKLAFTIKVHHLFLQSILLTVNTADHLLNSLINTAATQFSIFVVHQHLLFNTAKSSSHIVIMSFAKGITVTHTILIISICSAAGQLLMLYQHHQQLYQVVCIKYASSSSRFDHQQGLKHHHRICFIKVHKACYHQGLYTFEHSITKVCSSPDFKVLLLLRLQAQ